MTSQTVGISPKLIAAVVTAVVTYLLGQEVLALPGWATVTGQAALVALAAFAAPAGDVVLKAKAPSKGERGQADPLTLLVYVIVVVILVFVLLAVVDRVH